MQFHFPPAGIFSSPPSSRQQYVAQCIPLELNAYTDKLILYLAGIIFANFANTQAFSTEAMNLKNINSQRLVVQFDYSTELSTWIKKASG